MRITTPILLLRHPLRFKWVISLVKPLPPWWEHHQNLTKKLHFLPSFLFDWLSLSIELLSVWWELPSVLIELLSVDKSYCLFELTYCLFNESYCLFESTYCLFDESYCLFQSSYYLFDKSYCLFESSYCLFDESYCLFQSSYCLFEKKRLIFFRRLFKIEWIFNFLVKINFFTFCYTLFYLSPWKNTKSKKYLQSELMHSPPFISCLPKSNVFE